MIAIRGKRPAPKARNIIARGKREAQRNASPLVTKKYFEQSTESAKYQRQLFRSFRASRSLRAVTRGDAPHVVRRLPLAFIFRAFGARLFPGGTPPSLFGSCPWLSYSAPLAPKYSQGGARLRVYDYY